MMQEDFDKVIRGAVPRVAITEERLEHFIDAVLSETAKRPGVRAKKRRRVWNWPLLMPVLRFAVPMAVAAALGLSVGETSAREAPVAQFSSLYLSTTLGPAGN